MCRSIRKGTCHWSNDAGWATTRYAYEKNLLDSVELVGICTDICVVSNALMIKSVLPELPVFVDASCCAGVTPEKHRAALEVMQSCQIIIKGMSDHETYGTT